MRAPGECQSKRPVVRCCGCQMCSSTSPGHRASQSLKLQDEEVGQRHPLLGRSAGLCHQGEPFGAEDRVFLVRSQPGEQTPPGPRIKPSPPSAGHTSPTCLSHIKTATQICRKSLSKRSTTRLPLGSQSRCVVRAAGE